MSDADERVDETFRYVLSRVRQADILLEALEDEIQKLGAVREKLADVERILRMLQGARSAAALPEGGKGA